MRHGGGQPDPPQTRRQGASRATPSANWSPRLVPASAWTSSSTTHSKPANILPASGSDSSTARLSGVVSRMFGGSARWRARRFVGVSPVRVSMLIGSLMSSTGRSRLRAMSVARAFSGLTYSVCRPGRGPRREIDQGGKEAGQRLAAAGRSDQQHAFPARAASSMASWCGRTVQSCRANQVAKRSGNVPCMPRVVSRPCRGGKRGQSGGAAGTTRGACGEFVGKLYNLGLS